MDKRAQLIALLEKGLDHFGQGDLDTAKQNWLEVLSLDPSNEKAKEYLQYLETEYPGNTNAIPEALEADLPFQSQEHMHAYTQSGQAHIPAHDPHHVPDDNPWLSHPSTPPENNWQATELELELEHEPNGNWNPSGDDFLRPNAQEWNPSPHDTAPPQQAYEYQGPNGYTQDHQYTPQYDPPASHAETMYPSYLDYNIESEDLSRSPVPEPLGPAQPVEPEQFLEEDFQDPSPATQHNPSGYQVNYSPYNTEAYPQDVLTSRYEPTKPPQADVSAYYREEDILPQPPPRPKPKIRERLSNQPDTAQSSSANMPSVQNNKGHHPYDSSAQHTSAQMPMESTLNYITPNKTKHPQNKSGDSFSLPPWASDAFKKTLTPKSASPKSLAKEAFAETYIAPIDDNPPLIAAPSPPPPADEPDDELELLLSGAEDLIDARDYSGAMELLELCLDSSPHHAKAKSLVRECEQQLESQYQEQFQDLDMIPKMDCHPDQLTQHRLDHQAGFVISQLDGHTSIQDLLLITGLEEFTLLRILSQLVDKNLVSLS